MSAVTLPTLPTEFVESDDPTVAIFAPSINSEYSILVDLTGKFETVREADAKTAAALADSPEEWAVDYRQAEEEATEQLETIQSELDEQIKAAKEAAAARKKAVNAGLQLEKEAALAKGNVAVAGDIDQTKLAADWAVHSAAFGKLVKLIKDEVPAMVEFAKAIPSGVKQAKGNSVAQGSRGWTPRLVSVTVDNVAVTPPTLGAAAKAAGAKGAGGRGLLANRLLGAIVTPDNLSTDPESPSVFTVKDGNTEHVIAVVGKVASADDSDD